MQNGIKDYDILKKLMGIEIMQREYMHVTAEDEVGKEYQSGVESTGHYLVLFVP